MRSELRLHRITFGTLVFMLILFVAFLLLIRPSLADERLEVIASLGVVILAAAIFTMMGIIEGAIAFEFGRKHRRELLNYLLLGLLCLVSSLYLAFSETASLQTIALVAAPHAILFGVAEMRLAQHLQRHPAYRKALFLGGLIEIALGIALLVTSRLSSHQTATLLGYVAIISILQLLPVLFHSHNAVNQQARMD